MKRFSTTVMLIGLAMLIHAISSDIGIDGMGGRRIANMGLMHDRLVNTILSGFVILGGLLMRMFGGNLADAQNGYLRRIDELPAAEFRLRLATTLLASGCYWVLLFMYVWPSNLAMVLMITSIGWYTFQPLNTYGQIKKVWLVTMVFALALTIWHVLAMLLQWINFLTLALFSEGVSLVESGNILVVFSILVLGPLVLSIFAFVYASKKFKNT